MHCMYLNFNVVLLWSQVMDLAGSCSFRLTTLYVSVIVLRLC